jgi:hypothetical protein
MEERLEPVKLAPVGEDDVSNGRTVDLARAVEDAWTKPLRDRALHLVVLPQQPVDDLVARRDRGAVPLERPQSF